MILTATRDGNRRARIVPPGQRFILPRRGPKKFTEPVALSSPEPVGFPLSRTALRPSFDLLALRSRCKRDTTTHTQPVQAGGNRNLRSLHYFHFPHTNRAIRVACSREVGPELKGREPKISSRSLQKRNSPTRWHFRPPNQLTFRLRVRPLGSASIYLRSVVGASGNLFLSAMDTRPAEFENRAVCEGVARRALRTASAAGQQGPRVGR